jgi:hypothetical protein
MLRLSEKWVHYLQGQPETGVGYQDTDIILNNGRRIFVVWIYNCEWADIADKTVEEPMIEQIEVYQKGERD